MCDRHPSVAQATILATGSRGVALEGDVRFSNEIIPAGSAFSPGQALSSGSLDYVADHSSELYLYGCRQNLVGSLPKGMPTVVDELVEVRVRELDGDTERKRQ